MTTTAQLNELMKTSAQDAVVYLKETHGQLTTLCPSDLQIVDTVLGKLALEHMITPLSEQNLYTLCSIFGAFVGEIFRNTAGGEWFMDKSVNNAPFIVLNYAGKSFPFASLCYEKLVKDPQVSIAKYYELAIGRSTQ